MPAFYMLHVVDGRVVEGFKKLLLLGVEVRQIGECLGRGLELGLELVEFIEEAEDLAVAGSSDSLSVGGGVGERIMWIL